MFFCFRLNLSIRHGFYLGVFLSWLACFAAAHDFSIPPPVSSGIDTSQVTLDFADALDVVKKNHAGEYQERHVIRKSIEGMLSALDPHCSFFSPSDWNLFITPHQIDPCACGIGATFVSVGKRVFFRAAASNFPAGRIGLRYGDELLSIDGESVDGWKLPEIRTRLSGRCMTMVSVTVLRLGFPSPITLRLKRERYPIPSVSSVFMVNSDVGYLSLRSGFFDGDIGEVKQAIHRLKGLGAKAILFDLRDNPGGLVNAARDIAAFFLPSGAPIVILRNRRLDGGSKVITSRTISPERLPLVILTNKRSASAAEIVAGALQDHDRALIVGEQTFGKGLVQTTYFLSEGYGLLLTSARYHTPSGRLVQRPYENGHYYAYRLGKENLSFARTRYAGWMSRPYFTDRKRVVYGGGGITPDIEVSSPVSLPVHRRIAPVLFLFVRQLVAGLIPGFEHCRVSSVVNCNSVLTGTDALATDKLMGQFRMFARSIAMAEELTDSVLDEQDGFIRQQLRSEMATAAYGNEKGEEILLLNDPVVIRAAAEVPQAQRLVME